MKRISGGFTLIEMAIVIVLIGVVSLIMSPILGEMTSHQVTAYRAQQTMNNRQIGQAFLLYASQSFLPGHFRAPRNVAGAYNTVVSPNDPFMITMLEANQISLADANDDNRAAHLMRAYQWVQGLTLTMPLSFQGGPQVILTYEYGVIYNTTCPQTDTSCNAPTPTVSTVITSSNYTTWKPTPPDFGATYVSSLPVQLPMLAETSRRLSTLRDSFGTYFKVQQAADPTSTANFFPNDGATAVASASSNQGCWYNWINLPQSSVLNKIGRSVDEYGKTAWRADIEYCRDYDPGNLKTADASPHYGAMRLHSSVSQTMGPDPSIAANNVFISF